jgi:hypothetical protein
MEQATASTSSPNAPSFAGLLAALATPAPELHPYGKDLPPEPQGKKSALAWNEDGLEDDVITLSYEHALRANERYHPAEATDGSLTQAADPVPEHIEQATPAVAAATPQPSVRPTANAAPKADRRCNTALKRDLKNASITIRMSRTECAQLHRRAAEAGLTVSAYLRSCAFETESLRAMVKDTMAQLRSATPQAKPASARRSRLRPMTRRLANLFTPRRDNERAAQA